jgi:hypothetical protein
MSLALWIMAGVLAVAFLGAGLMKLIQPKEKLASSGLAWTEDFSAGTGQVIGTHARRKEPQAIAVNLVLLALAAVVAWGRFGPYAFPA